jgi:predicted RNase H-like HicB family nuclease
MNRSEIIGSGRARYECSFHREPRGRYRVRCDAFPGLLTFGDDLERARANARDALAMCVEAYDENRWPLPPFQADTRRHVKEISPVKRAWGWIVFPKLRRAPMIAALTRALFVVARRSGGTRQPKPRENLKRDLPNWNQAGETAASMSWRGSRRR